MTMLSEVIEQEMKSNFKMLKTAVSRLEGEFWKEDEKDWVYGYILFHVFEAIEFYMNNSADEWKPMNDVSANSRTEETIRLKSKNKSFFEDYLARVETLTFETLSGLSEDDLLGNDGFAPRGFKSRFHKFTYVIRHSMYHLGELTKTLRSRDMDRIRWE